MIKMMLIAGAGGFVGTCGRFLVNKWSSEIFHGTYPWGTFLVNIIGCFIFGIFFGLFEKTDMISQEENVLLITGFCGGFTTFSTFSNEMWELIEKGDWTLFFLYLVLSIVIGVLFVGAGRALIR